jgi:lipooligosaccharide transport system permease protein
MITNLLLGARTGALASDLAPKSGRRGPGAGAMRLVERNTIVARRLWYLFLTGFLEPVLYLFSIGVGVGKLVGALPGPGGAPVPYDVFVAPGLMAAAAMNGSVLDTTFNFFVKFKYAHTYDAVLASPLGVGDVTRGEVLWAVLRGTLYSCAFLGAMVGLGLVKSPWAVLAVPAASLIAVGFAGAGLAATTWMRSWTDFDYVNLTIVPLFLFSATFFPLSRYPDAVGWIVRATPLYQGVAMERALVLGGVDWSTLGHAVYLMVLGAVGIRIATARLGKLLQP